MSEQASMTVIGMTGGIECLFVEWRRSQNRVRPLFQKLHSFNDVTVSGFAAPWIDISERNGAALNADIMQGNANCAIIPAGSGLAIKIKNTAKPRGTCFEDIARSNDLDLSPEWLFEDRQTFKNDLGADSGGISGRYDNGL